MSLKETKKIATNRYELEITVAGEKFREAIKEEMVERGTEELIAGSYIVRYTNVISNRFDSVPYSFLICFAFVNGKNIMISCYTADSDIIA